MANIKKAWIIACVVSMILLVIAVGICISQFCKIQQQKIYTITTAYHCVKIELEESKNNQYEDLNYERLEFLYDSIPEKGSIEGDYNELSDAIAKVAKRRELDENRLEYLEKFRTSRLSTINQKFKWSVRFSFEN